MVILSSILVIMGHIDIGGKFGRAKIDSYCYFNFFSLLLILGTVLFLVTDSEPAIRKDVDITHAHIDRIKQIFDNHRNHIYPGELGTAKIASEDVDTTLNYLTYLFTKGNAQVQITGQHAQIHLSIPLSMGTTTIF